MKIKYQNPTITVVHIEPHQMLAASEQLSFGSNVDTASGADARYYDYDFEDEEDYDYE